MTDPEESAGGPLQQAQGAGGGEDRASALRVLAVGALLLLLAAAGGLLLLPGDSTLEPDDFLAEVFAEVTTPLLGGLVVDEGRRLPTGERLVRFAAETPVSGGVVELTIIEVPSARGEAVLKEQLTGLRFESSDMGGGRGGSGRGGPGAFGGSWGKKKPSYKLREKGTFRWHGYDADFARLWHPVEPAPTAGGDREAGVETGVAEEAAGYETVRVNLSTGGRCLLAYLRFDEGQAATQESAATILSSLRPVDQ